MGSCAQNQWNQGKNALQHSVTVPWNEGEKGVLAEGSDGSEPRMALNDALGNSVAGKARDILNI